MPQSNEVKNEQARLRMQKMRNKSVTKQGVTGEGVTRIEFIKQELNDEDLIKGIEAASLRFNDRDARYERAYRYFKWRRGEVIEPAIPYALVYDRERLEKVTASLKEFKQDENVYYGVSKSSVDFEIVGQLLEVTQ